MSKDGFQNVYGWGLRPKSWRVCRIKDVLVRSNNGFIVDDTTDYIQVTVRVRHRGISARGRRLGNKIKTKNQNRLSANQFLISKIDARNGACGIVPADLDGAITTHDFLAFDIRPEFALPEFWNILSAHPKFVEMCRLASEGTTNRVRLRPHEFMDLTIPLPTLGEQERIVGSLRAVDDAIRANEAVIARTLEAKKALAHELLTRGIPGRHSRYKDSLLGRIPSEWAIKSLGAALVRIEAGKSPKCEERHAGPDEWGVLKVSSVSWNRFLAEENKALPRSLVPPPELEIHAGDLLVSRANTPELVGRSVVVGRTRPRLILSDKTLRLIPNLAIALPEFLNLALGSGPVRAQIENGATGSSRSMKNISQDALRQLVIALPPIPEQQEIVTAIGSLDHTEDPAGQFIQSSIKLRSVLRTSLLCGQIGGGE